MVFQCRDEGPIRAKVRWVRPSGRSLPPGSQDFKGRLEIPNIKVKQELRTYGSDNFNHLHTVSVQLEHKGEYICEAIGYSSMAGSRTSVTLEVEKSKLFALKQVSY